MIELRTATLEELTLVLDWAAAEGWNPGLDDADAFYAADSAGFFVALEDGSPTAFISVVNHNDQFSFLGLYIVTPTCRGRGIGLTLWRHALEHAGARTVGLDGVPEQQENYKQSGFRHAGGTTRYVGRIAAARSEEVRIAVASDMPSLQSLEAAASGVHKPAYLTQWFKTIETRKTIVLERNGGIDGFCTVRQCRDGGKIGPLLASSGQDAECLIRHAAQLVTGPVSIDVPDTSTDLTMLCQRLSLTAGFQTARMYRGKFTPASDRLFAVTTLELG